MWHGHSIRLMRLNPNYRTNLVFQGSLSQILHWLPHHPLVKRNGKLWIEDILEKGINMKLTNEQRKRHGKMADSVQAVNDAMDAAGTNVDDRLRAAFKQTFINLDNMLKREDNKHVPPELIEAYEHFKRENEAFIAAAVHSDYSK